MASVKRYEMHADPVDGGRPVTVEVASGWRGQMTRCVLVEDGDEVPMTAAGAAA